MAFQYYLVDFFFGALAGAGAGLLSTFGAGAGAAFVSTFGAGATGVASLASCRRFHRL